MTDYTTLRRFAVALLAAVTVASFAMSGATALLDSKGITADRPDSQTAEVTVDYSNSADVTVAVTKNGDTVTSTTVSGASGDTKTISQPLTGLSSGDYQLNISSTDEQNTNINETVMVTQLDQNLSATTNETVDVDVGFDYNERANATVTLTEGGTTLNTTTLEFDPVEASDGEAILTESYTPDNDRTGINATIETDHVAAYDGAWITVGDDSGTIIGGIPSEYRNPTSYAAAGLLALLGVLFLTRMG